VRVGATYSYAQTILSFSNGTRADFERHAAAITSEVQLSTRSSVQLGAGGIADGRLTADRAYSVGPGWIAFGAYAYRIVEDRGAVPFVLGSVSAGMSVARTSAGSESAHLAGYDVRAGLLAGKTFGPVTPYLAARVFGGPVLWRERNIDVTGTDKFHYQPAVGAALSLGRLDVSFEWAFAGERAVTAGLGITL
jgi:hypothetical protein